MQLVVPCASRDRLQERNSSREQPLLNDFTAAPENTCNLPRTTCLLFKMVQIHKTATLESPNKLLSPIRHQMLLSHTAPSLLTHNHKHLHREFTRKELFKLFCTGKNHPSQLDFFLTEVQFSNEKRNSECHFEHLWHSFSSLANLCSTNVFCLKEAK